VSERDDELAEIQRLYADLPRVSRHRESPEYQARIAQIRAHVDAWRVRWGDDMIVAMEKAPNFKT
jgi:hypothetical protein